MTPVLAALLLSAAPGTAQITWSGGKTGQNGSGLGPQRVGRVQFELTARDHVLLQDPDGSGSVVVREDPEGPANQGHTFSPRTGLPNISLRQVKVLLPYEASREGLRVRILDEKIVSLGYFEVAPTGIVKSLQEDNQGMFVVEEFVPDGVQLDDVGRDMMVYSANNTWPRRSVQVSGTECYRALRFVNIVYSPFRWNPVTKELTKVMGVRGAVQFPLRPSVPKDQRDSELGDPVLANLDIFSPWNPDSLLYDIFLCSEKVLTSYDSDRRVPHTTFLIITTDQVAAGCEGALHDFMHMKHQQGHKVSTVTVEWIEAKYPAHPYRVLSRRATSIRKFLLAEYDDLGIEDVLLIGDPDPDDQTDAFDSIGGVPMLMTWPHGGEDRSTWKQAPTDMYYGELSDPAEGVQAKYKPRSWDASERYDGTWDLDADGFPGEHKAGHDMAKYSDYHDGSNNNQGFNTHHFVSDFGMEVNVARIPFEDCSIVNEQLSAQIEYQTAPVTDHVRVARRTAFLAMAETSSNTDMASLGRKIESELLSEEGFTAFELYQSTPYTVQLEEGILPAVWANFDAGLVVCSGPGSSYRVHLNPIWHLDGYLWDFGLTYLDEVIDYLDPATLSTGLTRSIFIGISPFNANPSTPSSLVSTLMKHACVGAYGNTGSLYYEDSREEDWGESSHSADLGFLIAEELRSERTLGSALAEARKGRDVCNSADCQSLMMLNAYGDPTLLYVTD
jgi:hypothetical protein